MTEINNLNKLLDAIDDLRKEAHGLSLSIGNQTTAFQSFIKLHDLQISMLNNEILDFKKKISRNEDRLNGFDKQLSRFLGIWLALSTAITIFGGKLWSYLIEK